MNSYILAYHDESSDDVRMMHIDAETWQEAIKNGLSAEFPIKENYSLTEAEAREWGYFINLKWLVRHQDGSHSLRSIL